jgi:hypothetical protein
MSMTETRLARIIRVVFLFWLVTSIALVVAMVLTLRPWQDQKHGRKETESSGLVAGTIEKCVAAKAFSHPIGVVTAAVPSFRHLRSVSCLLTQAESSAGRGASLWRDDGHEESQVE